MAGHLIPEDVWHLIEPLLPPRPAHPKGGRPVIADRDVLTGIIFMLKTGIAWEDLPTEMGCGCGMTCLRRLREWQRADVWPQILNILQTHLRDARRMDWSRVRVRLYVRPATNRPDLFGSISTAKGTARLQGMPPPGLRDTAQDQPDNLTLSGQEST